MLWLFFDDFSIFGNPIASSSLCAPPLFIPSLLLPFDTNKWDSNILRHSTWLLYVDQSCLRCQEHQWMNSKRRKRLFAIFESFNAFSDSQLSSLLNIIIWSYYPRGLRCANKYLYYIIRGLALPLVFFEDSY
jgi:hypothetical protein